MLWSWRRSRSGDMNSSVLYVRALPSCSQHGWWRLKSPSHSMWSCAFGRACLRLLAKYTERASMVLLWVQSLYTLKMDM